MSAQFILLHFSCQKLCIIIANVLYYFVETNLLILLSTLNYPSYWVYSCRVMLQFDERRSLHNLKPYRAWFHQLSDKKTYLCYLIEQESHKNTRYGQSVSRRGFFTIVIDKIVILTITQYGFSEENIFEICLTFYIAIKIFLNNKQIVC